LAPVAIARRVDRPSNSYVPPYFRDGMIEQGDSQGQLQALEDRRIMFEITKDLIQP
jgi:hypothetical protein